MEFCKVASEYADEILWSVTIQMKALCLYLHMILFVFQNFTKWNLGICFRLNLAVAPCLLPKISGGITITIIVITVTTSLSLSQPWSFFFVTTVKVIGFPPPLQPSSMRHWRLASLGLRAQKTHFRSLFFGGREATTGNASAVRRPAWGYAHGFQHKTLCVFPELEPSTILVYGRV